MKDILAFLQNLPQIITIILLSFIGGLILLIAGLIIHAYKSGRKLKIWSFEIEGKSSIEGNVTASKEKEKKQHISTQEVSENEPQSITSRICLLGSKTWDIDEDKSKAKLNSIKFFYQCFIELMDRTPYGFNACGAEPWREIFYNHYCEKLRPFSKDQIQQVMQQVNNKVCWYWFPGDDLGFSYEPAFYHAVKTSSMEERLITEVQHSDVILALAGRTGTKNQVELLLKYHREKEHEVNFHTKIFGSGSPVNDGLLAEA